MKISAGDVSLILENYAIFWRFCSSRPWLGCVHWKEIFKKVSKNRFFVIIRRKFGSSTELKFQNRSLLNHELWGSYLKFIFWPFTNKIRPNSKSSYQDRTKNIYSKLSNETPLLKTSSLQETAHKIWLILKPKTYCFPPTRYWLARLAQSPCRSTSPKSSQKQQHLKDFPRWSIFCQN